MKIAIDVMGGDNAPYEIIKGAKLFLEKNLDTKILLVGKEDIIKEEIKKNNMSEFDIEIIPADEVIEFDEQPTTAIRRKKNSSIVVGMNLLKNKDADAFVSAGSTGALLAGGIFIVGRIKNIKRPALSAFLPTPKGRTIMLDIGANADIKAENLLDFAIMGSLYTKKVSNIERPTVALLNNGTEEGKGSELTKEAYKILSESKDINFIGNIEAREVANAKADVVVSDGFTGNIYIKTAEGIAGLVFEEVKSAFLSNLKGKIAALLMKSNLKSLKKSFNADEVGGAPFLGVDGVLIKAHGSSNAYAFSNAIRQAKIAAENKYIEELTDIIDKQYKIEIDN